MTTHKPLKVAAAKLLFLSVYGIGTTCSNECFSFHMITGRQCFERNTYFIQYLHNSSAMLIPKFQNKTVVYYAS